MNRLLLVVLGLVVVGASGCGWTVESARETAAQKTCDYFVRCNLIGAGKTYTTREDCLVQWRASTANLWPTSTCATTLNSANLELCLKAIDAAACNSGLDLLSTGIKCTPLVVCMAPADGG